MHQPAEKLERQIEPVDFFGIDGEAEVERLGLAGEIDDAGKQFSHDPGFLLLLIARMQSRQFDRDRWFAEYAIGTRRSGARANHGERIFIGGEIAARIFRREGSLAQHVEGEPVILRLEGLGYVERLLDGAAKHELLAHDAHRMLHRIADEGLSRARDETLEVAANIGRGALAKLNETPGEHQAPGGSIDEQRFRLADMALPLLSAD